MRNIRFALAAYLAAGVGNVFAQQQFATPSQLPPSAYSRQVRYMEPAARPISTEHADPAAPAPVMGGAPVEGGACGMDGACGQACGCCNCCGPRWYGTVGGLIMSRSHNDPVEIAYDPNNIESEWLGSQQVQPDGWQGGFELRVGRYLDCNHRIEGVYWTLDPDSQTTSVAGPVNSALDFNRLEFNGSGADPWFQNSLYQQISMSSEFHNFELNLWCDHLFCDPCCCSRLQLSWLHGFRFFRFNERFDYASADQATALGVDPASDAYYSVKVENNLLGYQIGCEAEYRLGCRTSVFATPRFGIFWNRSEQEVRLQTGDGIVANDLSGRSWNINSEKDTFATIAQLDVGLNYQVSCNLSAYVGYRLVAASGVALSTDQIPQYMSDPYDTPNINTNGHLFLHGVQAGLNWRF